jgi:hypothetical protein
VQPAAKIIDAARSQPRQDIAGLFPLDFQNLICFRSPSIGVEGAGECRSVAFPGVVANPGRRDFHIRIHDPVRAHAVIVKTAGPGSNRFHSHAEKSPS